MQILWPRITPVIPAFCFTIAIVTIVSSRANADSNKTYGTVTGTLTINSVPDTQMQKWYGDPKAHYVMRADQSYTATSTQACNGKFDPHGEIGIYRYYQTRDSSAALVNGLPNFNALGPMSAISLLGPDRPANSPFTPSHTTSTYGPYTPEQSTYGNNKNNTNTTTSASDVYGVETIELVYIDGSGNTNVLAYQRIDVYQPKIGANGQLNNVANFFVQNFQSKVALNTDTTKPYLGDPPRVTVTTSNKTIYPGATFYVVIYPGVALTTPPASAKRINSSVWQAPAGDNAQLPAGIYMDIGNSVAGSGTYTLQAMQYSPTNSQIGTETFGAAATFSLKTNYNVTSQLGLSK